MIGFIRRLFGIYTPVEERARGKKYVQTMIEDVAVITCNDTRAECSILYSLTEELKEKRNAAFTPEAKAYAQGIADALEEWLERSREKRTQPELVEAVDVG
jgi:hypothetical protein